MMVLLASTASASETNNFMSEKLGCFIVVPPGWNIDTSLANELILTDQTNSSVYVSIKKYPIEPDNQIGSKDDLRTAIMGLYTKLGMQNVEKEKIQFTIASGKADFETTYDGFDSSGEFPCRKLLKGIIGRKSDNGQVLYLLIAAAPGDLYKQAFPMFKVISGSLHITDKLSENLFPGPNILKYLLIFIVIVLTLFFFSRNRRIQKSVNPLGADSGSFWRCSACGRVNHIDSRFCKRCGEGRTVIHSVRKPTVTPPTVPPEKS
jgi:hypothetical protein